VGRGVLNHIFLHASSWGAFSFIPLIVAHVLSATMLAARTRASGRHHAGDVAATRPIRRCRQRVHRPLLEIRSRQDQPIAIDIAAISRGVDRRAAADIRTTQQKTAGGGLQNCDHITRIESE